MKRMKIGISFLILTLIFVGVSSAQIQTDRFFPDSTKGFFAVNNVPELRKQWQKTELGQIVLSEPFADFRQSILSNLEKSWTGRFGMTIQDTLLLASGEIACGLIASPGKTPGFAIALDVSDKKKEVEDFLTKLIRQSFDSKSGSSKSENLQIAGSQIPVTVLILPPDDRYPATRTVYYVQAGNYLLAAEQKEILALLLSKGGESISTVPSYTATMKRCQSDFATSDEPQIRFFIQPLEFGKAIYALSTANQTQKGVSPFDILAKQGFDAIEGVGGTIDLASENFEFVSRVKVYIPADRRDSLKIFSFVDEKKLVFPHWVGADVNRASLLNLDFLSLFNNIGPIFNDFLETPGLWEETLQGLEKDEQGPKVNLKTQLVANLGTQISTFRTLKNNEEKFVGAVEIQEGKTEIVAEVFHRMFDTDPDFQKAPFGKGTIWLYSPQKKGTDRSSRSRSPDRQPKPQAADDGAPSFIRNAFYVGEGNIFFSNDIESLKEVVENRRTGKIQPLEKNVAYQSVMDYIQKFSGDSGHFFQSFTSNQKGIQANYELIKSGHFLEGKTLLARVFKRILSNPDQTVNSTIKIDGSKLPPFSTIEKRIGVAGAFGKTEPDGWFFKGFGISSKQLAK